MKYDYYVPSLPLVDIVPELVVILTFTLAVVEIVVAISQLVFEGGALVVRSLPEEGREAGLIRVGAGLLGAHGFGRFVKNYYKSIMLI